MKEVFELGEMVVKEGKSDIYPVIDKIVFNPKEDTVIKFTLPVGLNPEKVESKKWLFQQQFDTDDVVINRKVREVVVRVR